MSKITINIDGKEIQTQEGEFILNAARANDIFIPAICYISRCSPTLACRICLIEADGKQVYACNAKSKDGMEITTSTENIEKERRAIMEVYDVNHPLQCGVCDQSGACELQNYTLELGVDSQNYTVKDVKRSAVDWGHIHYDPGLCIVCEKCVTICKDMTGDNALKTVPRDGDPLEKEYKETMPKDAYAMWNKLNKSLIGTSSGEDMLDCVACGECASVCPVGALVDTHFMYQTNVWELEQIPATCPHTSDGTQIIYDVKEISIDNSQKKIYRVMNDWNYTTLSGASRYGFDFENKNVSKDEKAFQAAVEAFKKADNVKFTSIITNEEALILQKLKEKLGFKLVNNEASAYNNFLNNYAEISGNKLYSNDLTQTHDSNFVISLGTSIKTDSPASRYALNNSMVLNKGAGLYFHPVKDPIIEGMGKNIITLTHSPLQEETVMYLILDLFADKEKLSTKLSEYLASFHSTKTITITETIKEKVVEMVKEMKVNEETGEEEEVEVEKSKMVPKKVEKDIDVDDNALLNMLGAEDDFMEKFEKAMKKKDKFSLIAGPDLYTHPNSKNLARLLALIEKYTEFKITMIPTVTNTLGVSLICELDDEVEGYTVGYNTKADFTLSALGNGDLDMPALNQQEGTLTSINKRVCPTNAALEFGGYELNDIANELGLSSNLTVEYTHKLGLLAGFKEENFDELPNHFDNDSTENRGYILEDIKFDKLDNEDVDSINIDKLEGSIIYLANPVNQFSEFTNKASLLTEKAGIYMSENYLSSSDFNEGDSVIVKTDGGELVTTVISDNKIDGEIAYLPTFDSNLNSEVLFNGYRFATASIQKV